MQEILINESSRETRVAVVKNQRLQELLIERSHAKSKVGNVYKGKVVRILPEMQAAFIDIGLEKNGFLHIADLVATAAKKNQKPLMIQQVLHQGSAVWVQVIKDSIGDKGPRLTMQLSLASRNLIFQPLASSIGISNKIGSSKQRSRIKLQVQEILSQLDIAGGFIIRTAAETACEQALTSDISYLQQRWLALKSTISNAKIGTAAYQDDDLPLRVIRDLSSVNVQSINFDSQASYKKALEFAASYNPQISEKITLYSGSLSLFDEYAIEHQIEAALQPRAPLPSGANLIIDPTEAMTTIDVNTASNIGKQRLPDGRPAEFIYRTNLEAVKEIAHQVKLRNLGGIVIVDFIDMQNAAHNKAIVTALALALNNDSVKTAVGKMSALGLVEITRMRTQPSLEQLLCEDCMVCSGTGRVKSSISVCFEILRQIKREDQQYKASAYTVLAADLVINLLRNDQSQSLSDLQKLIGRPIKLQLDPQYQQHQYDIVLS